MCVRFVKAGSNKTISMSMERVFGQKAGLLGALECSHLKILGYGENGVSPVGQLLILLPVPIFFESV
jgi:hypothetical protein